jgi:predicted permease
MRIEHWWYSVPQRIRAVFRRREVERDLDDELRDHIERQTAANLAGGMTAPDARRAALVAFGGVERVKDESRDVRGISLIDAVGQWRLAARSLGRSPAFTLATILTIALAVGTAGTIGTVIDTVLLRPLRYPDSERLVGLWHEAPGMGIPLIPQAPGTYSLYRNARSFESIGAYGDGDSPVSHGDTDPVTERLAVAGLTASIFPTLGARALIGRVFTETDELSGAPQVVVVSEHYWRTRLASTAHVIGMHIGLDGIDREIVGVMPATFGFPGSNIDVWAPFHVDPEGYLGWFGLRAIGKLRPGVSVEAARTELSQILQRSPETFAEQRPGLPMGPMLAKTRLGVVIHTLRDDAIGGFDRILWLAAGIVAVLVLVALSNISSLILARLEARQREFGVRSALGASVGRVWWAFLAEVLILAGAGGLLGISLAAAVLMLLPRTGATQLVDPRFADASRIVLPRLDEIHPNAMLVWLALGCMLLLYLAAAIIAAGRLTTRDIVSVLRSGGRGATAGAASRRLRAAFVAAEVALSLVLLSGSAMLMHSLQRLSHVDPGFEPGGAVSFWTSLRGTKYFDQQAVARFYRDALDRIGQISGVDPVGIVSKPPLENGPVLELVHVEDAQQAEGPVGRGTAVASASAGYFRAIGIPLRAGRTFDENSVRRGANEAVVGLSFAIHYWGDSTGRRALGRRVQPYASAPWHTIVGVVGDVRDTALSAAPTEVLYVPHTLAEHADDVFRVRHDMAFVLRTRRPLEALGPEITRAIHAVDPTVPVLDIERLSDRVSRAGRRMRFVLVLLGTGAAMTLALGVVGLYGVIAYLVSLRSREIGIRIALGLTPARAARFIAREGGVVIAIGALVGTGLAVGFAHLLRSLTYGVPLVDTGALAMAVAVVVAVACAAAWLPARRASRIDPAEALRVD